VHYAYYYIIEFEKDGQLYDFFSYTTSITIENLSIRTSYTFSIKPYNLVNIVGPQTTTTSGSTLFGTAYYTGLIETYSMSPGTYSFNLHGASPIGQGLDSGHIEATYIVESEITIMYIIGGPPDNLYSGSGGTYIYDQTNTQWLFVAGGRGGGGYSFSEYSSSGDGNGGDSVYGGSGGGGVNGDGGDIIFGSGGKSFINGSTGGVGGGGFGGGGGGSEVDGTVVYYGGGGGYTGGFGLANPVAYQSGFGFSYFIPTVQAASISKSVSPAYISIEKL